MGFFWALLKKINRHILLVTTSALRLNFLKICILNLLILSNFFGFSQQTFRKIENKTDNKRVFVFNYEIHGITPSKIARFQQRVPLDFKINKSSINDLHIIETSDMITLIWQSLPADTVLKFSFEIIAPNDVQGTFHMGEAAFMTLDKDNQLLKISFKPCPVLINDAPYTYSFKSFNPIIDEVPCGDDSIPAVSVINKTSEIIEDNLISKPDTSKVLDFYYRIQVSASRSPQNPVDFEKYLIENDVVFVEQHQGYYKYTIGTFKSFREGQNRVKQYKNIRKLEGFLVGYRSNIRTDIQSMPDYGK